MKKTGEKQPHPTSSPLGCNSVSKAWLLEAGGPKSNCKTDQCIQQTLTRNTALGTKAHTKVSKTRIPAFKTLTVQNWKKVASSGGRHILIKGYFKNSLGKKKAELKG